MVPENVAKPLELGGALVLQAKRKCLGGSQGVQGLESAVVAENVQDVAVGFPQELKPWSHELTVGAVLRAGV